MKTALLALLISLATFAVTDATAQRWTLPDDLQASVDSVFSFVERDTPGCALGIYQNGALAYGRGYGLANLDWGIPISTSTVFDIGSVSKQFTAAAIVALDLDETLSIDDDVRKWIPELPEYGNTITIRHLLNHTSGIRDYLTLMSLAGRGFLDVFDEFDGLELIVQQKALNFAPGEEYLYSNSGYLMLANIVRRATGMSVRKLLEERFFDPLGMAHSSIWDDNTEIVANRATGYSPGGNGWGIDHAWNFQMGGDGQVLTSVDDLLKWENNFYVDTIGGQDFLDKMHTQGRLNNGDTLSYALGLDVDKYRGVNRVSHGGAWAGFRASLARYPDQHTSIAVLCNRGNASAGQYQDRVADILLAGHLDQQEAEETETAESTSPITLSDFQQEKWQGLYRSSTAPEYYPITFSDGILTISAGGDSYPMSPRSETRFVIDQFGVDVFFGVQDGRNMLRIGDLEEEPFTLVEQAVLDPSDLDRYVGTYFSDELGVRYIVSAEGESLTLSRPNKEDASLSIGMANEFTAEGISLTFENSLELAMHFQVHAGRVTGIVFRRETP